MVLSELRMAACAGVSFYIVYKKPFQSFREESEIMEFTFSHKLF